jgi:large subunit ribosomal protein L24
MAIKKNDSVKILTGRDKGKTGKVVKVFPKISRVLVEGINTVKKH